MLFALIGMFVLLVVGKYLEELEWLDIGIALLLAAAFFAAIVVLKLSPHLLTAGLAVIDIGLVFKIFKGNIRIG
ncbi:MAG TPA: hypothetical protein VG796_26245 [Verrucomicrobiales bacterium]|nr:hypothetical protein [Verrucomicrobiales bacterium]